MLDNIDWEGLGSSNTSEVLELRKALSANESTTDSSTLTGGGALQPQSLEASAVKVAFDQHHLVLWNKIAKAKAESTYEEYIIQDGYGQGTDGFVGQLDIPLESDTPLSKGYAFVKFIRQMYRTSDVGTMVKTITPMERMQIESAMKRTLRIAEGSLFDGDTTVQPNSWNGIYKSVVSLGNSDNVIDMRGEPISEIVARTAAEIIYSNWGMATDFLCSTSVKSSIDNLFNLSNYRIDATTNRKVNSVGQSVGSFVASYARNNEIAITPDVFLNREAKGVPTTKDSSNAVVEGKTNTNAPDSPSITVTAQTGVSGSLFADTGSGGAIAGKYYYRVSAINNSGQSQASTVASETVVAGGSLTLEITPAGTGNAATGYVIYRSPVPASATGTERLMSKIAVDGSPTTTVDLNSDLPGTSIAYFTDFESKGEERSIAFKQLVPMYQQPLAKLDASKRGFVALYGTPIFYAINKNVVVKNIGVSNAVAISNIDL